MAIAVQWLGACDVTQNFERHFAANGKPHILKIATILTSLNLYTERIISEVTMLPLLEILWCYLGEHT